MFTVEQRDALRERVLRHAKEDDRIVAGAVVGSLAVDEGDRFSDLDLTFGIADRTPIVDELDAVHLVDLVRDPTIYRVYVLPDALQFDLSMTPAAHFRPAGPRFQLRSARQRRLTRRLEMGRNQESSLFRRPRSRTTCSVGASFMLFTRVRASSADVPGRPSTASAQYATTRSRSRASIMGYS